MSILLINNIERRCNANNGNVKMQQSEYFSKIVLSVSPNYILWVPLIELYNKILR